MTESYIQAYDIGEDGDRWLVSGTNIVEKARLAVIELLLDQTWPISDLMSAEAYEEQIRDALTLEATTYNFVVVDKETECVYSNAPSKYTPITAYTEGVDYLGHCVAIGFTMPKWSE